MQQPPQAEPVSTLDRIEHIAYGRHLLRHASNASGPPVKSTYGRADRPRVGAHTILHGLLPRD
jgi:hypothetical protein